MAKESAAKPAGSPAKLAEKRTKFVELAERRTANAIRSIRVIGKLGNPFAYEYDERDVKKIVNALERKSTNSGCEWPRKAQRIRSNSSSERCPE